MGNSFGLVVFFLKGHIRVVTSSYLLSLVARKSIYRARWSAIRMLRHSHIVPRPPSVNPSNPAPIRNPFIPRT